MISRLFVACLALLLLGSPAFAGKYNKTLSIGDLAPDWTELPGIDGKKHSLKDYEDKECLIIAFTCNTCPYAQDYEKRLINITKKYAEGNRCAVIAINANQVAGDRLADMQERAKSQGINYPYLHDETQATARAYGATYTPEFVVLDKDRKVVYLGAFDDNTDEAKVRKTYVADAVAAVLDGKSVEIAETPAVGCAVRYIRSSRKKKS